MNQTSHIPQTPNERLKAVRNSLGLNQRAFAKRMDVTQVYISAIEVSKNQVSGQMLSILIKRFNVSADWMLTGKGQMFLADPIPARLALHEKCHPKPYQGFVRVVLPISKS